MKIFVTGCAGFIGSNLVDRLLNDGHEVVGYDNFSTGIPEFLKDARKSSKFKCINNNVLDTQLLGKSMRGCDFVFHMAANADVRHGLEYPFKDLQQNTIATFNILEAMRANDIKKIVFPSTGSIYGEHPVIPTPEDAAFPIQTSLYGASKLACEGLIQAYCEGYGMQSWIFRFVSILGNRYTHGHVWDFTKQLLTHPDYLNVLGDGTQTKSYLHVQDCIDAMIFTTENSHDKINIFNLGSKGFCTVNESIDAICKTLNASPELNYSGGKHGWVGDNPYIYLDTNKIRKLGWKPKYTIRESIIQTTEYLKNNKWLFDIR
ncbi:MAG: NAD-dependent epimerase/dehydratase family protein [Pedobacter sp.]|uniref:NAD-dependent epimerase/dehydratase family protein n=1 Tax=Pedobacter sp. TaxID=1411316 RepID=UPI003567C63E